MKHRTLHIVFAATIFGAIIWISVSMHDLYQLTVDVPLTIEGIPDGWAVRTPIPPGVQLKLRANGWRFASLMLGPDMHLSISANGLSPGSRTVLLKEVAEHFVVRPDMQLLEITPDTVAIELDRLASKRLPVQVDCSFVFGEGYGQVGAVSVTPESVTVSGADAVLKTLSAWLTEHQTFDNLRAPLDAEISLVRSTPYLLTIVPSRVHIQVNVEPFAEKTFGGLPVETRAVPSTHEVILVPPRIELVVRAGIKQLSSLSASDFHVSVDYTTILADTTGTADPQIIPPAGVQIVRKRPERLTYIIRKPL